MSKIGIMLTTTNVSSSLLGGMYTSNEATLCPDNSTPFVEPSLVTLRRVSRMCSTKIAAVLHINITAISKYLTVVEAQPLDLAICAAEGARTIRIDSLFCDQMVAV
jgi:hypothetical protein